MLENVNNVIPESTRVETSLYFMKRDERHRLEKPYTFRFEGETDLPPSNFEVVPHENVRIHDIRGRHGEFSVERDGFCVLKIPLELTYSDFFDVNTIQTYFQVLEAVLKAHLGAYEVQIFRHAIRKRHPLFPVSTGGSYEYDQPTSVAHIDTTLDGCLQEVRRRRSFDAERLLQGRVQWINAWKPLRGPLNDWPLALCDVHSIDAVRDFEPADILYEDYVVENYQLYYQPTQHWYFLSDHQVDEVIVFKQSDTDPNACPGVPHCSFANPLTGKDEAPRESIEVRALVFYD